jgi:hypothetical protein
VYKYKYLESRFARIKVAFEFMYKSVKIPFLVILFLLCGISVLISNKLILFKVETTSVY